jgi:hypothetical protein
MLARRHGQICIWTNTDPRAEADFNARYDPEHMQEHMAIPDSLPATAFSRTLAARGANLALYVIAILGAFRSALSRHVHITD